VAYTNSKGSQGRGRVPECAAEQSTGQGCMASRMAYCERTGLEGANRLSRSIMPTENQLTSRLADAEHNGLSATKGCGYVRRMEQQKKREGYSERANDLQQLKTASCDESPQARPTHATHSGWASADWLGCRDRKWRAVEPGTSPLAHGPPRGVVPSGYPSVEEAQSTTEGRVMRLKGYGNAIVPQVAAVFISAFMDVIEQKNANTEG
jgi:DNA (cytosine-5)-methyltransferase 1